METSKNISEIIKEAVKMVNEHDWFWCMADYTHPAMENAKGHMAAFVKLTNSIDNSNVREALRNLWLAKYKWASKNMMEIDKNSVKEYEAKEDATLTSIYAMINQIAIAA